MSESNGGQPRPEDDPRVRNAIHRYRDMTEHLGAVMVILSAIPLEAMLAANEAMRPRVLLTLPVGTTPEQAAAVARQLDVDERVIKASLRLVEVVESIKEGR